MRVHDEAGRDRVVLSPTFISRAARWGGLVLLAGVIGCGDGADLTAELSQGVTNPFAAGSVSAGWVCGDAGLERRLVFTAAPRACEAHADIASGEAAPESMLFDLPEVEAPGRLEQPGRVCLDGRCTPRTVRLDLDEVAPRLRGRWSVATDAGEIGGPLDVEPCDYLAGRRPAAPDLSRELEVEEVALYQGVKVPLYGDAVAFAPDVPIVAGRQALLRVFYRPRPALIGRRVAARLQWQSRSGAPPTVLTSTGTLFRASSEPVLASTLGFDLPGELVTEVVDWSLELHLADEACPPPSSPGAPLRIPESGTERLQSRRVGRLAVTLVPFRYLADRSGRLPDLDAEQLELYRRSLLGMFPVERVDLRVREPVDYTRQVGGDIASWGALLNELYAVRAADAPPPETYYYGLIKPTEEARESRDIAGVASLPGPADESLRGGVGLGHAVPFTAVTLVHELGHAMGRPHAPCGGPQGIDRDFPRENIEASIGSWGYDITGGGFRNPRTYKDFMSYCGPAWVSDYTFARLAERLAFVNGAPRVIGEAQATVRLLSEGDEGPVWTAPVEMVQPQGRLLPVVYLDAGLRAMATGEAVEIELDHGAGIFRVVPEAPPGAAFVRLGEGSALVWPRDE